MSKSESVALIVQGPTGLSVDRPAVEAMYVGIETQIAEFKYDLTTEAGRSRAASLAYGIAKKRTSIEADKKKLKEGLIAQGKAIDGAWNEIKEKLESLQEMARKPLTEWEVAEEARLAKVAQAFASLSQVTNLRMDDTAATVAALLAATEAYAVDLDVFQERHAEASALKSSSVNSLKASLVAIQKAEADRIELEKLRAIQDARDKADKEAAQAAELAQRQKEETEREASRLAEAAERERLAEEQRKAREAAMIEQAAKAAEEKTRRESEAKAKAESDRIAAEHAAELEKERKLRAEAEEKQRAEAKRIADEETRRNAEAQRVKLEAEKKASEDKKLEANKKHRAAIMTAAKVALMEHAGLTEDMARKVALAISTDKIPNVSMRFS